MADLRMRNATTKTAAKPAIPGHTARKRGTQQRVAPQRVALKPRAAIKQEGTKRALPERAASQPPKPQWSVYIVRCADGSFYTGVATDVVRRIAEHNGNGTRGARYTRARRPVKLVYHEPAASRSEAGKREYAIKQLSRAAKQLLIAAAGARKAGPSRTRLLK